MGIKTLTSVAHPRGRQTEQPGLEVRRLGVLPYGESVDLQKRLVAERRAGKIPDVLLLVQHPHVVTLGVSARHSLKNLHVRPAELHDLGVELHEAPRGGDVTYHGPGQLVGYPIVALGLDRRDVHRYVRDLEEVLIRTVRSFDVRATRVAGLTGIWVENAKLAAIGVRLSRWVTSHGFALNVTTDLSYFRLIRPCGIEGRGVTSLAELGVVPVSCEAVAEVLTREFGVVFDRSVRESNR